MKLLDAALRLAHKGKFVFPCRPGAKEPLTGHGFKDSSTDPEVIRRWWTENPEANLAIATGLVSGVVVLDVDIDSQKGTNGEATLSTLVAKHGPLPQTTIARTPRGGRHLYFKHPGPAIRIHCSTDKLGSGLDVRGDGGYVLAPPSRTDRGEYRWESKAAPAEPPQWLLGLLTKPTPVTTTSTPEPVGRNANINEAGRIRDALRCIPASLSHDDWVRVLMALHTWDPNRGKALGRDWSATCPEKFHESELEAAWRSFKLGGGVGLGTLFEIARRHGWRPVNSSIPREDRLRKCEEKPDELFMPKWPDPPRAEAYHGVLGDFVRRLEPHTESDPMAILVQALVGFGNLVGRTVHFSVEADEHYCNLNAATVGNSSKARKGTAWGHVRRLLRQIDSSWPRHLTGLSTGEGLISCVRDVLKKPGKEGEDEVIVDPGVADKRLLVVESEFGRTLQCANREGNTLSAVVRQAFDTGDLQVATKGSPQTATGAHISIIGHITSIELNLLLTQSDTANGFANRFLWVAFKRSKLLPEGGQSSTVDFSDIIDRLRKALDFAKTAGCIAKDAGVTVLWRDIYQQLSHERPGLLGAVTSRAEAVVMRLAMIFAVTDCSNEIKAAHLRAAMAVWEYCEASAAFIFGDSLGNPLAERVLQILHEAGDQGRGLSAIYEALSGHVEKEELHAALKQLHGQGLARQEMVPTSGRPRQVWFASEAAGERNANKARKQIEPDNPPGVTTEGLTSLNSLNSPDGEWEEAI